MTFTIPALVSLIVVIVIAGLAIYLIDAYVPIGMPFKIAIRVLVVLALILYLLRAFGLL